MSHVTSRASQCDVIMFLKLPLTNSYNIVLATFRVLYDIHFVLDVFYKKFTKLLTAPRMLDHPITVVLNVLTLKKILG